MMVDLSGLMLASVGTGHQNSPLLFYTCAHAHVCVVSEGEMEPHGVFREVTALCTNKDHYQQVRRGLQ